jgi:hypothetical protein
MKRLPITDGSGAWFDADRVKHKWNSAGDWGDVTKYHEHLYLTARDKWVLETLPIRDKDEISRSVISAGEATKWLLRNEYDLPSSLEDEAIKTEI